MYEDIFFEAFSQSSDFIIDLSLANFQLFQILEYPFLFEHFQNVSVV